jgi:hypothetical protein
VATKELYKEKEILEAVNLCSNNGNINDESIGWSRNPIFLLLMYPLIVEMT